MAKQQKENPFISSKQMYRTHSERDIERERERETNFWKRLSDDLFVSPIFARNVWIP